MFFNFKIGFLFLFCLTSLAARTGTDKRDKFHRYQSLSKSYLPIVLDDSTYDDLVSKPRDYHTAILLTAADSRYGCQLCRDFQPEWELLAKSWNKAAAHLTTRMLFGTLDFDNGKVVFQKVSWLFRSSRIG